MPKVLVQKFGGTSVDRPEHRRLAALKIIAARDAGFAPVVVVSAIGRRGAPYATDTLIDELNRVDPTYTPASREMDIMMGCGEIISTAVMAVTLQSMGHPAVALTGGQAGIHTDSMYGNARIQGIDPSQIRHCIESGLIPVVCGFQGVCTTPEGRRDLTTLGRGGSDTTAAALGAALQAEAVEIYTDVDGVKTADPDMVRDARTLSVCSYAEVAEIAHLGAKVVHPRAVEIAMDHGIDLWVKSTFTDHPGTRITAVEQMPELDRVRITGVTHTGKIAFIRLEIENEAHKPIIEREVYRLMGRAGINIFLTTFSPTALSFAVTREMYPVARDLLDGMVVPVGADPDARPMSHFYIFKLLEGQDLAYRNQRPLLTPLENLVEVVDVPGSALENATMVSVVAANHRGVSGVVSTIYRTLSEAGITILQLADSEMSISVLVPESDAHRAVRLLHDALRLGTAVSE
jgi:aspartate kinase